MLVTKHVVYYHNYFGDSERVYDTLAEAEEAAAAYNRYVDPPEYARVSGIRREIILTSEEMGRRIERQCRREAELFAAIKADQAKKRRIEAAKLKAWDRKRKEILDNGVSTDLVDTAGVDFSVLDDDFDSGEDFPF